MLCMFGFIEPFINLQHWIFMNLNKSNDEQNEYIYIPKFQILDFFLTTKLLVLVKIVLFLFLIKLK